MKRRNSVIQLGILALLGVAVLLTLFMPELTTGQTQRADVEISVILSEGDTALYSSIRLGMEQAAVDHGAELRFLSSQDYDSQVALLQREVSSGVDAAVIEPADPAALGELVGEISVPVLSIQSEMEGAALCVSVDNGQLGRQVAEAVLADFSGGSALIVDDAGKRLGIIERQETCAQILLEQGWTVTIGALDHLQAVQYDAVISLDDNGTQRLANWGVSLGIHPELYGVGGSTEVAAELERGTLEATVAWSDYAMGYITIEHAVQVALGNTAGQVTAPTLTTIRGETIYDPDNQKLLFPVV